MKYVNAYFLLVIIGLLSWFEYECINSTIIGLELGVVTTESPGLVIALFIAVVVPGFIALTAVGFFNVLRGEVQ